MLSVEQPLNSAANIRNAKKRLIFQTLSTEWDIIFIMIKRLFYAVNFTPRTTARIQEKQDCLRRLVKKGNWSRRDNFHITLHYVGRADEEELPLFGEALKKAVSGIAPFTLGFSRYGSFRQGSGDLIFLTGEDKSESMERVSRRLREILKRGDMKPMKPHITLVRQALMDSGDLKRLKRETFKMPGVLVPSVELMESRTIGGKLTYTPLCSVHLKGNRQ